MALIHCSDCGTEVSSKASACPRCANPINEVQKSSDASIGLFIGTLMGGLIGAALVYFSMATSVVSITGVTITILILLLIGSWANS